MKKISRVTILSSLGSALEYYDFIIYGLLSPFMAPLFFEGSGSLLQFFAIFIVGYLARPLGGILFGSRADRLGRKNALIGVMLLMASSTFLMGLLPTRASIGVLAPLLLTLLRFMQGISFGAELPGAITMICEYSEKKRGLRSSFVLSGTSIGAILASFTLMILTKSLSAEKMLSFGWRIPFIFGGVLALISFIMRLYLQETPSFVKIQEKRERLPFFSPLKEALYHFKETLTCILLNLLTASLVILNIYFASYLKLFFHYPSTEIFQGMTLSLMLTIFLLPFFGGLADRFKPEKVLSVVICLFLALGYFLFQALYFQTKFSLFSFLIAQQIFTSASISSTLSLTASLFPTKIRFTGISFTYNSAYVIAAFLPLFFTKVLRFYPNPLLVFYVLALISVANLVVLKIIPKVAEP